MKEGRNLPTLEIRRDSPAVVNWVNGTSKCGAKHRYETEAALEKLCDEVWAHPVDRTEECAKYTIKEHEQMADTGANRVTQRS